MRAVTLLTGASVLAYLFLPWHSGQKAPFSVIALYFAASLLFMACAAVAESLVHRRATRALGRSN